MALRVAFMGTPDFAVATLDGRVFIGHLSKLKRDRVVKSSGKRTRFSGKALATL